MHTGVDGQEQLPQTQPELHVWVPYVLHVCVAFGVHVLLTGHEQAPHAQVVPQVCDPYVLQACVEFGVLQNPVLLTHALVPAQTSSPPGHAHVPPGVAQIWPDTVQSPLLQQVPVGMHVPLVTQYTCEPVQPPSLASPGPDSGPPLESPESRPESDPLLDPPEPELELLSDVVESAVPLSTLPELLPLLDEPSPPVASDVPPSPLQSETESLPTMPLHAANTKAPRQIAARGFSRFVLLM